MQRLDIAYSLIVIMVAALTAAIFYLRYHSRERTYRRRLARERRAYEEHMEAKERGIDGL